jgi:WG containing repeat
MTMHKTFSQLICASLIALACLGIQRSALAQNAPENLLPVQQNGKWGYINRSGEIVIKPQFESADFFADGLALVRYALRKKPLKPGEKKAKLAGGIGFIDQTGKVVLELDSPLSLDGDSFSEGLVQYSTNEPGKGAVYGYIDTSGKIQIKARFTVAYPFVDGLAAACIDIDLKCGFIDKTGEFAIEPKYVVARPFSEGFGLAGFERNRIGFVNKSGEMVIEPQFGYIGAVGFHDGLSVVAYPHGRFGYINTEGTMVIPMQFEMAQPFSDGLAAVRVDSKWGYIDKTGKFVIKPQFINAGPFSEGLASVSDADSQFATRTVEDNVTPTTGFIDKQGKQVFSLPIDFAEMFVNGVARVRLGFKLGYIDKTGKYIWEPSN